MSRVVRWLAVQDLSEIETLSEAARLMREQHGPEHERHAMWETFADFLDSMCRRAESKIAHGGIPRAVWAHERWALNIARAYLATSGDAGSGT